MGSASDSARAKRTSLAAELRRAIETDQLLLHYQPKARFNPGPTGHLEALVRWNHPERGLMGPGEFISLAESAGLIKPLSVWVLNASLKQSRSWHDAGMDICVAVNLSARTLHDPELVPIIAGLLISCGAHATWLEVEITETALMKDLSGAMSTLTQLRSMGVRISIDDFGVGYSSLSYLTRLPADQIKIDKSFVLDMTKSDDSAFIVRSVIDLGHNFSLEVVAEGVEDQETWDLLADMGCDIAQGFHLSRPMPAIDVQPWLSKVSPCLASARHAVH